MQGRWAQHFGNTNPITLELACGKGEYAVGLAALHHERNFIGIDLKGNRKWVGAKRAIENKLGNVAFVRAQIDQLADYFGSQEISEVWITFPDPQLRLSRAKKRLTHPKFLRVYERILQPGAFIHLKTDSPDLYQFTKKVIELYGLRTHVDYDDVYSVDNLNQELQIKTHYEALDIAATASGSNDASSGKCWPIGMAVHPLLPSRREHDRALSHRRLDKVIAGDGRACARIQILP